MGQSGDPNPHQHLQQSQFNLNSFDLSPSQTNFQFQHSPRGPGHSDGSNNSSGGTISPNPAQALAYANAQLSQYLASGTTEVPSGIPAPVNNQKSQQFQPTYNQNQPTQAVASGSALPHYLNPQALSNALSDYASMSTNAGGKGKAKSSFGNKANAWNSAPVSAGHSPPGTPATGAGGAKQRASHVPTSSLSNSKKKKTGSSTTGATTPSLQSSKSNASASNSNSTTSAATSNPPASSSRVAASSVTGKRLNWAEMIVFTIADQPEGRMVVHDLFEGMVAKYPAINEWADGAGWEVSFEAELGVGRLADLRVAEGRSEKGQG